MNGDKKFNGSYGDLIEEHLGVLNKLKKMPSVT